MPSNKSMSKSDASRIQSSQAKARHNTGKSSFTARAQSAADKDVNTSGGSQQGQSNPVVVKGKGR